jgi:hypothetical protein
MRNIWKWVILCLTLAVLLPGCGGGNFFDGVWTGKIYGDDLELAFANDFCFMVYEQYETEFTRYTFMRKEGILVTDLGNLPAELKGNTLTITVEGTSVVLVKDTKTAKAPAAINGGWEGPDGMIVAFINDKVYFLDMDLDGDYGTYTFSGSSGSIKSRRYRYELDFTVKGNTITVTDEDLTFTRIR